MILTVQILLTAVLFFSGCGPQTTFKFEDQLPGDAKKILIVYLSRTNNTRTIAEYIHSRVGGKRVALELIDPYPENYQATVEQVKKENETNFLPPLKTRIANIQNFDFVFIGFPTWGMQVPPPVKTFLHQYNLKGKTVIPFNTNAGYGVGSSFQAINELCSGSKVLEGFSIKGGMEKEGKLLVIKGRKAKDAQAKVDLWLKKIGMLSSAPGVSTKFGKYK